MELTAERPPIEGTTVPRIGRRPRLDPMLFAVIGVAVLGFGLRFYYMSSFGWHSVQDFDDGAYYGDAIRLVQGGMPYRDFSLVNGPGIMLLMAPVAALTNHVDTAAGLIVARVLTVVVSSVNIVLVGLLLRHRGMLAVLVACATMALYRPDIAAAHTVLLEPWLTFFCLIGALLAFPGGELASGRRVMWAGVAFGFAGCVKVWAILPVLVVIAIQLARRRKPLRFLAGVAGGFLVPALPFLAMAPKAFFDGVVLAQLLRTERARVSLQHRLGVVTELNRADMSSQAVLGCALVIIAVLVLTWVAAARLGRGPRPVDYFLAIAAGLVLVAILVPAAFFDHYAAFFAPFAAGATGAAVAELVENTRLVTAAPAAVAALVPMLGPVQPLLASHADPAAGRTVAAIRQAIPQGACALADRSILLVAVNRIISTKPNCSLMVDALGTDLQLSAGHRPSTGAGRYPAVREVWHDAFAAADYVVLSGESNVWIPWTAGLREYFHDNFARVTRAGPVQIYKRAAMLAGHFGA